MNIIFNQILKILARKTIQYLSSIIFKSYSSSVTIHTIATKSDSDVHSTRKSIDNHENQSLLSPDLTKKSRRQNTSTTSGNIQTKPTNVPSDVSTTNKLENPISSMDNKYLSKETRFFNHTRKNRI